MATRPDSATLDRLRALARAAAPSEAVAAVFAGRATFAVVAFANRAAVPASAFLVDPIEFAIEEHDQRVAGRALIAWFHSHPGGRGGPSAQDLAQAWPGVGLWIGTLMAGGRFELAGWDVDERGARRAFTVTGREP
ncbi:MAG: Mov34/MPN/PAD-1 family protein [Planctomycetes bacterium]|nr:Mov34/MPN/PAD-1 family protein [Planctomycetota bacterium]